MTDVPEGRKVAAELPRHDDRSVRRAEARLKRATVVTRGPRAGKPTRLHARARALVRSFDRRRVEDKAIGRELRRQSKFARAGQMPHVPNKKKQEEKAAKAAKENA